MILKNQNWFPILTNLRSVIPKVFISKNVFKLSLKYLNFNIFPLYI